MVRKGCLVLLGCGCGAIAPSGEPAPGAGEPDAGRLADGSRDLPASAWQRELFARARLAVGYSYYWGHAAWRADGAEPGACSGGCPSCRHTGRYGADCSGFLAKVWQVPAPSGIDADEHPYSTEQFYGEAREWRPVPRSALEPGDALIRRSAGTGHALLVEATRDPWGHLWVFEARSCATGIVHHLRGVDGSFIAIRRKPP